jgi:hypothetical protein
MCAVAGIGSLISSFFTADAGATAAGTAATAAGTDAAGTAAATAATSAAAASTAAVAPTVASTAAATAGTTAAASSGIATTISEAAAVASGASSLATLAAGPGRINVPPVPVNQMQTDITVQNAEQQQLARREAAGGLQSTVGTSGGQAGAILNPSTLSQRSVLGG